MTPWLRGVVVVVELEVRAVEEVCSLEEVDAQLTGKKSHSDHLDQTDHLLTRNVGEKL